MTRGHKKDLPEVAADDIGVEPTAVPMIKEERYPRTIAEEMRDRKGRRYFLLMTFSLAMVRALCDRADTSFSTSAADLE